MKKIVKGNDFTMRIPVVKMVDGEKQAFPLPGCTDLVVRLCSGFSRYELTHTIDAKEDNVLLARVEGDEVPLGEYALEVKGKLFGNDWRSNEYEQVAIVDKNADADTELGGTDEGDASVEMDTAVVYLPPSAELSEVNKYMDIVKLPVVEVPTSAAELTMQPNRMYAISIGDTLTISLAEPTDKTVTNEWQGSFDVGETVPTVTWPENVTWAFAPSIEANCHYEFSIRYVGGKYYGIVYGWAL